MWFKPGTAATAIPSFDRMVAPVCGSVIGTHTDDNPSSDGVIPAMETTPELGRHVNTASLWSSILTHNSISIIHGRKMIG